jgi:signal transduction histidine kinase
MIVRTGEEDAGFRDQAMAEMRREAERMSRMIRQLLILARADAGAEVPAQPVDLASVIRSVSRHARGMSRGASFHVDTSTARLADIRVHANPDYLEQQLLILLDNAFKYTPGDGEVHLSASVEPDRAQISVSDTGPGIGSEDLPRIFERFYRGDNVNGTTGSGLGLAIAQWIATQHHGSLRVESQAGRGATFTIDVPCEPWEDSRAAVRDVGSTASDSCASERDMVPFQPQ